MATDSNLTDVRPATSPGRRAWQGELAGYAAAAALVAAANLIAHLGTSQLNGANLAMLFLVSVLLSAFWFGLGPALLSACAAALSYNFFFLVPHLTFHIEQPADLLTFVVFFAVATSTGWLAARVRDQGRNAARRANELAALLEASGGLSAAATPDEAARVLAQQAGLAAGRAAIVLLPETDTVRLAAGPDGLVELADSTRAAARQAWETGADSDDPAGWSLRPLQGLRGRVGVIGLRGASRLTPEQDSLLNALLHQGAVALERANLAAAAAEVDALRKADHLRSALLNSISHDFRTPLATVLGASTTLLDYEASLKPAVRRDLLLSIAQAARRLNRYVGDLLDMSRLEGGALAPKRELTDVRAILASAMERLDDRLAGRPIRRDFAAQLSQVSADPVLLEQAVLNVIENAASYSPEGAPIELAVHEDLGHVLISIEDQGAGIPPDALDRVFDRFRRLEQPTDRGRGLGLGLSIAKGFIEAMGGRIAATSPVADGKGTRILIALPKPHPTPRDLL